MNKTEMPGESDPQTNGWGIDMRYEDALHRWHTTSKETVGGIIAAMGGDTETAAPPASDSVMVVRQGSSFPLSHSGVVELENGQTLGVSDRLPRDLPLGYHRFLPDGSQNPRTLIISPEKCWLPEDLKTWGWAVQLYAARSNASWGIGDFADLDMLARWSAEELRAGMMLLNPLSAASPVIPQQSSPYFPTSRAYLNLLWLHIEWIPGANHDSVPGWEELVKTAHKLNTNRLIDRDKIYTLKLRALDALWKRFAGSSAFERFCQKGGESLDRYASFCTLAEHFKSGWHSWPGEYRHPSGRAVAQFARDNAERVRFHKWIQFLLDEQLERGSKRLALMQDLPIGVDPDGADAWIWQDVMAHNVGVGAPPDEFNTGGQNWGLPPFIPHKLRAVGYRPLIETIRAAFRHGGGLRIDHVMGLFRLFWIPQGMSAAQGAYVRYNADEMLAVVALESQRARAYVVGEDLGTVEDSAREKLAAHSVLSYRLLWFEKDAPAQYPQEALSAVSTHDLPTVAGLWTGSDLKKQRELGLNPNVEGTDEIRDRLERLAGLKPDSPLDEVVAGAYGLLAQAPSRLLTAALDDALLVQERPNIPATNSDANPNWSIALPVPIEVLMKGELPVRIAHSLQRPESESATSDGANQPQVSRVISVS